jgi:ribonuclease III
MFRLPEHYSEKDRKLAKAIRRMTGYAPLNLTLYRLATIHSSVAKEKLRGVKESNERLEFLGDAVLDMVIADYLFKKFPFKDEGFLTEIKARIVNRESLNELAKKIGVNKITEYEQEGSHKRAYKSIYGNTLEAIIGALYLDVGFAYSKIFIINKLLIPHIDLHTIVKNNPNYKSKIIEWSQKENKELSFEIIEVTGENHHREFTTQLEIDQKVVSTGNGYSKKKAEQDAAFKACELLNIE